MSTNGSDTSTSTGGGAPRRIDFAPHLHADIGADGVAELVLGPEGGMPSTDALRHALLGSVWARLAALPEVRCILVRSSGKGFCAGGDPSLVREMLDSHEARLRVMQEARAIVQGMMDCEIPIVSAINGAAVGAGAAVALLADISIAGEKAKIIDGHTRLGVAAGDHAALIWPLLCGMAKARMHLLLCTPIDGAQAERIGLVGMCVPDAELLERARGVARQLAAGSAQALAATKRSLNHWLRMAWPAFEHSLALEILGFASPEAREGFDALNDKRAPQFAPRTPPLA